MKPFILGISLFFGGIILLAGSLIAGGAHMSGLVGAYDIDVLTYVNTFIGVSFVFIISGLVLSVIHIKEHKK